MASTARDKTEKRKEHDSVGKQSTYGEDLETFPVDVRESLQLWARTKERSTEGFST